MKIYDDFIEAQTQLKYWKDKEAELRTKICTTVLEGKSVGTHNITKGKYKLKAVKKISYVLDPEMIDALWDDLSEEEKDSIKYSPKLLLNEYKELEDHEVLDQAITIKPAMPTLTIEYVEEEPLMSEGKSLGK